MKKMLLAFATAAGLMVLPGAALAHQPGGVVIHLPGFGAVIDLGDHIRLRHKPFRHVHPKQFHPHHWPDHVHPHWRHTCDWTSPYGCNPPNGSSGGAQGN